jgi:hypothetical protein
VSVRIALAVGVFFLVLATVFAFAARSDFVNAQRQWASAGRTRRRVAVLFAIVGFGLLIWRGL